MFLGLATAIICFFALIPGYIDFFQNINNAYTRQKMPEMIADFCRIDPASCPETPSSAEEAMFDLPVELLTFTNTLLRGGMALIIAWFGAWGWQKRQIP